MKIYLPFISCKKEPYYGLALGTDIKEDISLLKADWWYNWNTNGQVPMLWSGNISNNIPKDYKDYILVFNEPNVRTQNNLTTQEAYNRLLQVENYYTQAKLVVGGMSIWAIDWYKEFLSLHKPKYIHLHTYVESYITLDYIDKKLDEFYSLNKVDIWITEFNVLDGDSSKFKGLIDIFHSKNYIKRIAPFTNRQGGEWWNLPNASLVDSAGKLTQNGIIYAQERK